MDADGRAAAVGGGREGAAATVITTGAFIAYLVDGFGGAALASLGVFLPCYFFVD